MGSSQQDGPSRMWKGQIHNGPKHTAGELRWDPRGLVVPRGLDTYTDNRELPGLRHGESLGQCGARKGVIAVNEVPHPGTSQLNTRCHLP